MTGARKHINGWWLTSLLLAMLTVCIGCSSESGESTPEPDPVLTFYVYAPERPMMTRAGDDVLATEEENKIHNLQIWVFETVTGNLVGYLKPDTYPNSETGTVYQMNVSKDFANKPEKPNVDVYVLANAAAAGMSSLGKTTTRTDLEAAKMGSSYFGVEAPASKISEDRGLPMSGVLRNQEVKGDNPILRIGSSNLNEMARVRLLRMVSKVRFVFSRKTGDETVSITGITIDGNMIPTEEFVFLNGDTYHIGDSFESLSATLLTKNISDVNHCENPSIYAYNDQNAQEYETLIDGGVTDEALTQRGPYFFKETDKKVSGTITYRVGNASAQTVPFFMTVEDINKRFVRNHSWIVYAYFNGSTGEPIISVWVDTNWQAGDHFVINN